MINKNYKKGSSWKGLMLFPVSIALVFFMACGNEEAMNNQNAEETSTEHLQKQTEEEIFYVVEQMPQWPGEEDLVMSIRQFIAKNLKYPDIAKQNNVEGKIFVTFMVTSTGEVVVPDPSILPPPAKKEDGSIGEVVVVSYRALDPDQEVPDAQAVQALKDEGVRVIELLPDLVPGKQRGKNVNVMFTLPITFKLH